MPNRRSLRLFSVLLIGIVVSAQGQEAVTPTASPKKRSVRISFLPPPLDGQISLGIYDNKGTLVRILHREAEINQFTVGTDSLSTIWDGKNDAEEDMPSGRYTAHGFAVGDVGIKRMGFFFNDFITSATSPRVRSLRNVRFQDNELYLEVELTGNEQAVLVCEPAQGGFVRQLPFEHASHCEEKPSLPNVTQTVDCSAGTESSLWLIDSLEGGSRRAIKQFSQSQELLGQIAIPENEPQPQSIAASTSEARIFLVEESSDKSINRLRAISWTEPKNGNEANWKTDFEKKIIAHRNFSIENGKPIPSNPKNKTATEKISVKLEPNPLLADARVTVELTVGFDGQGSFLKTNDGLPLRRISEIPRLERTVLGARGSGTLDVFQDDGAVVEQIRLTGIDRMMSFDCGSFELK